MQILFDCISAICPKAFDTMLVQHLIWYKGGQQQRLFLILIALCRMTPTLRPGESDINEDKRKGRPLEPRQLKD